VRPLPLKLAFRLPARGLLLPELLLRRGERGDLLRQGRLQPLGLFEGRAAPLKLGAGGDDLGLPCRRDGARPLQILASPAQRVVPLHQRRPHPLDREGASRDLGALLRGQVQQGLSPVRQPPVRRSQGLDEGVQGLVLPPVPMKVGVEAVEGVVSLPGPALQLLPPTSEARRMSIKSRTQREWEKEPRHPTKPS
jgi:hypothetical protein